MYRIVLSARAIKDMRKLTVPVRRRVNARFDVLRMNPCVGKKLEGELAGMWSLRVWPYRILYSIERVIVTVTVLRVGIT